MDGETPADPDNPTASRGQVVVLDAAGAGTLDGHRAAGLRRHPAAGDRGRARHAPRSPPATSTAATSPHFLLKEISEAPASFRKTLRGKLVERDGRLHVVARRPSPAAGGARRPRQPVGSAGPGHRPGHGRRRRPEPGRRARPAPRRRRRCASRRCTPPSCRASSSRRDMSDTLVVAISQSRHHDRHQPHRRPGRRARRPGHRHREPAQQRPHRQGRRRALHVRRPRRRDERRLDQGLLRPDRRRAAPGRSPSPTSCPTGAGRTDPTTQTLLGALRELPDAHATHASSAATTSPVAARQFAPSPPLLGRRRQRAQPDRGRGDADQAVRALLQVDRLRRHRGQEAHRPVQPSR